MSSHEQRRSRLVDELRRRELAGALVSTVVNVRYLTGFTGSNAALLIGADGAAVFFTDGRYRDQAATELPELEHVITRDLLAAAGARMGTGRWAVETHTLSVDAHAALTLAAGDASLVPLQRAVETLRVVKDAEEIAALRRACSISTHALEGLITGRLRGRSERDLARELEHRMYALGADAIAFDTILAAGPNAAIPHHVPGDRPVARGDLLKIDFGARVDGYHADCTRTFTIGPAADWQQDIHAAVERAQSAGLRALTEGAEVAASLAAVRAELTASGWLEAFTTGLGHGVGLEIHEDPFITAKHTGKLNRRTVMTMEPGIYLPGRGGVRIEDTVIVTAAAPEVLTTMTTDLLELA